MLDSIRALADAYPPETVVYSGHGPPTTLGDELARNPFLAELRASSKIERPRGTHDILPSEQPLWRRVTEEMERLCALYGYRRIQTPVFEDTELFARTSGAGSDVVQKEMYTFTDRSDRSLTLRPEGTAPICRAYIEHGLHREPQPQKLYTIGRCTATARPAAAATASTGSSRSRRSDRTTLRSTPRSSSSTTRCCTGSASRTTGSS